MTMLSEVCEPGVLEGMSKEIVDGNIIIVDAWGSHLGARTDWWLYVG